jgi:hypothetical protein
MSERDIEALLRRYRPADPPEELARRVIDGFRVHGEERESRGVRLEAEEIDRRRTWPWAVAAAALLALTVGLHAAARVPPAAPNTPDVAHIAAGLGNDAVAWQVAALLALSPVEAHSPSDPLAGLR